MKLSCTLPALLFAATASAGAQPDWRYDRR